MSDEKKVNKIVPSKLENLMYKFLYKYVGERIPENVTPNQVTGLGALFGLFGIISSFVAIYNRFFLIGTIVGLVGHLVCDDLDGYVARKRKMTSTAGAYFDLLTDILHITFLIIGMSYAGVVKPLIALWMVPVYAIIIFTSMNSILYLNEFPFPRLGPIETHMFFAGICIVTMIFGTEDVVRIRDFLIIKDFGFNITDIVFILGCIPMYFEMIRLQIQLFKDLKRKDNM